MLDALIAVRATPLPEIETDVIAPALNSPDAPRNTIVLAPLAVAAVVRAFATVPVVTFEPFIALIAEPFAVMIFAVKFPDASRATMVLAPLASEAVVLALAMVPLEIFDALIAVKPPPAPLTVVNVPTFAVNDPLASLATIVEAPFDALAVVEELASGVVRVSELRCVTASTTFVPLLYTYMVLPAGTAMPVPVVFLTVMASAHPLLTM
jgi:hypothetical protein